MARRWLGGRGTIRDGLWYADAHGADRPEVLVDPAAVESVLPLESDPSFCLIVFNDGRRLIVRVTPERVTLDLIKYKLTGPSSPEENA